MDAPEPILLSPLMSPAEVARVFGIHANTLSAWRHCGKPYDLPYIKVGKCVRYKAEDVVAFLNANTIRGRGEKVRYRHADR